MRSYKLLFILTIFYTLNAAESKDDRDVFNLRSDHHLISSGRFHSCGIDKRPGIEIGGTVKCWGHNDQGQASPPHGIFVQVSSGHFHSCALTIEGVVKCWGSKEINHSIEDNSEIFDDICSGEQHSCAIRSKDGTIKCWGRNDFGELNVPSDKKFIQVSCGNGHTCGIMTNGEVECWGKSRYGESHPPLNTMFKQISVGPAHHACGITSNSEIKCWGNNNRGQSSPIEGQFKQVSAGARSTCAIHENLGLKCWGSGSPIDSNQLLLFEESRVLKGASYKQISSGHGHLCALLDWNGKVHCWASGADFKAHEVPLGFKAAL